MSQSRADAKCTRMIMCMVLLLDVGSFNGYMLERGSGNKT